MHPATSETDKLMSERMEAELYNGVNCRQLLQTYLKIHDIGLQWRLTSTNLKGIAVRICERILSTKVYFCGENCYLYHI